MTVGLVVAFLEGRKKAAAEAERERPVKAPTRVEVANGENVVTLDQATQTHSGITLAPLEMISHRRQLSAYGAVVDLQELTDLRNAFETAQAQLGKARTSRGVAQADYERVKALFGRNQNVSQKTVQVAEGTLQTEESNVQTARAALHAAQATALQHWGGVLTEWLAQAAPEFEQLRLQKHLLVQVTLAAGQASIAAPQTAQVQTADGRLVSAAFVSPAPRTDPKIQGRSFFYVIAAEGANLLPGMNVTALLPVGEPAAGVVVPASAVVWLQGKAWAYAQIHPDRFARREVSTEEPVPGGWFEPPSFSTGQRFVVEGPQVLLSEEFRAQISVGEEGK
ncbi:MAG: multidrug transporter [Phycisphaerae bacterium]|nr:multidrug transporter [Phycisphaerae bacterium]